jgi:hypothetical protein
MKQFPVARFQFPEKPLPALSSLPFVLACTGDWKLTTGNRASGASA